jgi:hypothetical protein
MWKPTVLVSALLLCTGCLGEVARVVLAPQEAAQATVQQVLSANAKAVSEALDTGQTQAAGVGQADQDLQRIIKENPDAENIEELQRLQQELHEQPIVGRQRAGEPPPPNQFDRRQKDPAKRQTVLPTQSGYLQTSGWNRRGHVLQVEKPLTTSTGRGQGEPWEAQALSTLPPAHYRSYVVDMHRPPAVLPARGLPAQENPR